MSERETADIRIDSLSGAPTVIVGSRQGRPNLPATGCPFCPGGLEAPDTYEVRWFVNRWPALPADRCELVLYSPKHDAEFWSLGVMGATKVVELWAERTASLGARADVDYVLIFENRGPEVGATISHPHGQIYAFSEIPPAALNELRTGKLEPASIPEELLVSCKGDWIAWVPEAAAYPFELRIAPKTLVGSLADPECDRSGLAAVLVDSLARLDQLFSEPMPYMMWIHQRPTDGRDWPEARVHLHITPLLRGPSTQRFVAAAELGSGITFNPVQPADAAFRLRACEGFGESLLAVRPTV
jgi:UDPglucose--hexose-1-phosphate uridylyltransferase